MLVNTPQCPHRPWPVLSCVRITMFILLCKDARVAIVKDIGIDKALAALEPNPQQVFTFAPAIDASIWIKRQR